LTNCLSLIESEHAQLSISRQCELLGVPRSTYYYEPIPENDYNLQLMKEIDKLYLEHPAYGSRLMTASLQNKGFEVNRKRIKRLMHVMGIEAIYPRPKIKTTIPGNIKFPYLLTDVEICRSNQVWGTDITYIPMKQGFLYLVAYIDLYSRYVLSWKLSNSLESSFCLEALEMAFQHGIPEIINSDQGVQYTSHAYLDLAKSKGSKVSMSGKGRCWDNIFVERLWRTFKYEEVYLNEYENFRVAYSSFFRYFFDYNTTRPHSSLKYKTPHEIYTTLQM
jgi:putative transposase